MPTNGTSAQVPTTTLASRRRNVYVSGLALRLLLALVISWLIIMAFFVTNVTSR